MLFLLAPGTPVEAYGEGGTSWHGTVEDTAPEQGILWIYTDSGERKLLDIQQHTVHLRL